MAAGDSFEIFFVCLLGQGSLAPRIGGERYRTETIHGNAATLVGWSDAAFGGQSIIGK